MPLLENRIFARTLWATALLIFVSFFAGCSTTTYSQNVSQVRKGLDKAAVLELLGSPNKSEYERQTEQHVWIYNYLDKSNKRILRVWWDGGRVARTQNINATLKNLEKSENFSEYERKIKESRKNEFEDVGY